MCRTVLCAIALVSLAIMGVACDAARAAPVPARLVVEIWQDQDSARFALRWSGPPVPVGRLPIAQYRTAMLNVTSGTADTVARGTVAAPATHDTLAIAWPTPGDTLQLQAAVVALDTAGQAGPWQTSPAFVFGVGICPRWLWTPSS